MTVWPALAAAAQSGLPACRVAALTAPAGAPAPGTCAAFGPGGALLAPPALPPDLLAGLAGLARAALAEGRPRLAEVQPGLRACADPLLPLPRLIIAGGGHVAGALAPAAVAVGFRVTVVEDRPDYARPERFPGAAVACGDMPGALRRLEPDAATFVVLAGRSHDTDLDLLRAALGGPAVPAYVGLLGSRRRVQGLKQQTAAAGALPESALAALRGPVGLDLGAETPAEIAAAVVAELVAVRRGGSGLPLSRLEQRPAPGPGVAAGDAEALKVWLALAGALAQGAPCALATVVQVRGSAPREAGARMLVQPAGRPTGTVGGGAREAEVQELARECIRTGRPLLYQADYLDGQDAMCGGAAEVFIEPVIPQPAQGGAAGGEPRR